MPHTPLESASLRYHLVHYLLSLSHLSLSHSRWEFSIYTFVEKIPYTFLFWKYLLTPNGWQLITDLIIHFYSIDSVVRTSYHKFLHPKEVLIANGVLNRYQIAIYSRQTINKSVLLGVPTHFLFSVCSMLWTVHFYVYLHYWLWHYDDHFCYREINKVAGKIMSTHTEHQSSFLQYVQYLRLCL